MKTEIAEKMQRPTGVWIIAIYAVLNALAGAYALSRGALYHGMIERLGLAEFLVSACEYIALVIAAALLFMLRKLSLAAYLVVFAVNLVLTGIAISHLSGGAAVAQFHWLGSALGWAILVVTLVYVVRLYRWGVLR